MGAEQGFQPGDEQPIVKSKLSGGFGSGGNYPSTWFLPGDATIAATAVDNSVIAEFGDTSMYNYLSLRNASPADGVTIQGSLDGADWSADLPVEYVTATPDIGSGEIGRVDIKGFYMVRALKNGTTNEIPSIGYSFSVK